MDFEHALRIVSESYGYSEIKDKQKDAVISSASGRDVLLHCLPDMGILLLPESADALCHPPWTRCAYFSGGSCDSIGCYHEGASV